jgi:hypothetical protein
MRVLEREAAGARDRAAAELGVADVGGRVDEREHRAGGGDRRRDQPGVDDRGAPRGTGVERVGRRHLGGIGEPVGLGVEEEAAGTQRGGELARAAARDDIGAHPDPPAAVARGDIVGRGPGARADDPRRAGRGDTRGGRVPGQRHGRAEIRGLRRRRQHENTEGGQQGAAHRATVDTRSGQDRSGVPARTARSSAGAGR